MSLNFLKLLESNLTVTPNEDLCLGESLKDNKKLLAARVISTLFRRLDTPQQIINLSEIPKDAMPIKIGLSMKGNRVTNVPIFLPLSQFQNCYISGSSGSGKSFLARVIIEEAVKYDKLNILILDPRNQAVGLRVAEDRESILSRYPDFDMKATSARGFDFRYFAPGQSFSEKLPSDLSTLGRGRNIVCFKWLNDQQRCDLYWQINNAVFTSFMSEESEELQLIEETEEAQLFTKKRVPEEAKTAASKAENSLDRYVREGRKYGCSAFIISQTIKDFSHDSASIRQNTNTKAFLRNSDREVDYASDFIGDGRQLIHLSPGIVFIHNSEWGLIKVKVRPPLSKVFEFSAIDTRKIVSGSIVTKQQVSSYAQKMLESVKAHYISTGKGINISELAKDMGITSKRKMQQLIEELERFGYIRTRKLPQRGHPRIIEPIAVGGAD